MRDVDAFKERIACDWGHPQGYKKNKYLLLSKKQKTKYLKANQNMQNFVLIKKCLKVGLQKT